MKIRLIEKTDPFVKRLFEIVGLILAIVMLYVTVESILIQARTLTIVLDSSLMAFGVLVYLLSRKGFYSERLVIITMVLLYASVIFFWFWISGVSGGTGVGMVTVMSLSFIFVSRKWRTPLLIGNLALLMTLCLTHFFRPELVTFGTLPYPVLPIEFMIISFALILLIYYLKREVDAERKISEIKNTQLRHLNQNLKSTVRSQKNTLRELNNTQSQLLESEKMASLGKLTAGLAHEIRNPLNFVGGVVDPLRTDIEELKSMISPDHKDTAEGITSEMETLLKNISDGTQMANDIIRRLQNISTRKGQEEHVSINLAELASDVVALVEKSTLDIRFERRLEKRLIIEGNMIEINQVLLNIIRNSIQAIPPDRDGLIQLIGKAHTDEVELQICDNGSGMDEETSAHVFNAFYTTKGNSEGTGLGLFIAKGIIDAHQGRILVDSTPGKGTCFRIFFPKPKSPNPK